MSQAAALIRASLTFDNVWTSPDSVPMEILCTARLQRRSNVARAENRGHCASGDIGVLCEGRGQSVMSERAIEKA